MVTPTGFSLRLPTETINPQQALLDNLFTMQMPTNPGSNSNQFNLPIGGIGGSAIPDAAELTRPGLLTMDSFMGTDKFAGWGGLGLKALTGIGSYLTNKSQMGYMEDALKEQQRQFDLNYSMAKENYEYNKADREKLRASAANDRSHLT